MKARWGSPRACTRLFLCPLMFDCYNTKMKTIVAVAKHPFEQIIRLFTPREGSLYSPAADVLMAGGASIICFVVMWFFVGEGTDISTWAIAVYYAAFFVNYPHFMASYQLIYKDARPSFTDFTHNRVFAWKLWWAGFIVPLVLLTFFVYALFMHSLTLIGYLANAMFFFVGWHYIKQIYGCVIVLSSAKRVYYTRLERWSILVPLYSLWAISFVNANLYGGQNNYYQIIYNAAKIPELYLHASFTLLALSTFIMVAMMARKIIAGKSVPPVAAMVALLSIYVWYIPALSHPFFLYIVPLFHSLQYLLFVNAYERNSAFAQMRVKKEVETRATLGALTRIGSMMFLVVPAIVLVVATLWPPRAALDYLMVEWFGVLGSVSTLLWAKTILVIIAASFAFVYVRRKGRESASWKYASFFFTSFLLGIMAFAVLPTVFDILVRNNLLPGSLSYDYKIFGVSLYLYAFTIIINIHHYFIDNVIWKSNNPHIRANLFAPKQ